MYYIKILLIPCILICILSKSILGYGNNISQGFLSEQRDDSLTKEQIRILEKQKELEIKFNVIRGERPPIDLEKTSSKAYEPGKISIKLQPFMRNIITDKQIIAEKDSYVKTGVNSIDELNSFFMVRSLTPMFNPLYDISTKSNNYKERHEAWGFHLWFELEIEKKSDVIEAVKLYSSLTEIEIAEPVYKKVLFDDGKYESLEANKNSQNKWTPNDPQLTNQWHYNNTGQQNGTPGADISLFSAWEIEKGLEDIIVSIQDGGIQIDHPDLAANMWSGIGYNFVNNSPNISTHNHGVHVAGTVSALNNNNIGVAGVAGGSGEGDGVRLMSSQVFTTSSNGGFHLAPVHAADNGAAISQNSWGYTSVNTYQQIVLDAIDYFNINGGGDVLNGGITIYAAGNSNATGNWYPGCYSGAFAVASTTNQDTRAYYSNYGSWIDVSAPGGETISVNARGVLSTLGGNSYGYYQGTSMACPHVSGVAALIISYAYRNGTLLDNTDVADILRNTTDDHYGVNMGYVGQLGTGRLNAYQALLATGNYLSGILNPKNFTATPISNSEIELNWEKNDANHDVLIIWNPNNSFGTPTSGVVYSPENNIIGGGIVLYAGPGTNFHHTDLNSSTKYYYRAFSYNEAYEYSTGITKNEITLCGVLSTFPYFENFNGGESLCWDILSASSTTWNTSTGFTVGYSTSINPVSGSHFYRCSWTNQGVNQNELLISPVFNLLNLENTELSFWFNGSYNWSVENRNCDLDLLMRVDNGNWVLLWNNQDHPQFTSDNINYQWLQTTIDLSQYDGLRGVQFAFRYEGYNGASFSVDEFEISGDETSVILGDVNNDGYVNIMDLVWMVSYIKSEGQEPENFNTIAGNITNSIEGVCIADLTALAELILNPSSNQSRIKYPKNSFD